MAKVHTLLHHHGSSCQFCGCSVCIAMPSDPFSATVDHDIPKARGGGNEFSNLILACRRCNEVKGDMTAVEFRAFLRDGKLVESYIRYMEKRLKKKMAGRAQIVIHEHYSREAIKEWNERSVFYSAPI